MKLKYIVICPVLSLVFSCSQHIPQEDVEYRASNCDSLPELTFNTDTIIKSLMGQLLDSVTKTYSLSDIDSMIRILDSAREDKDLLFPHQKADSALYIFYEPYDSISDKSMVLEKRKRKWAVKLCDQKLQLITSWINNPMYFDWGKCETQIPEAKIEFYSHGLPFASILFSCSHDQVGTKPWSYLIRGGGLNEMGRLMLDSIKPWK